MIHLTLEPDGATVHSALTAFLGPDRFARYRQACSQVGARWSGARRVNVLNLAQVPAILEAFRAEGLEATVHPSIAERLRGAADEARALQETGRARLAAVEPTLPKPLYNFQRSGIEWLVPRQRACLGDDMGLGKTCQALLSLPEKAAALVVVPSDLLARNWVRECTTWRPDLYPQRMAGRKAFRWPRPGELLLVTDGSLPETEEEAGEPVLPAVRNVVHLLWDEAHRGKSPKAQRTQRFRALRDAVLEHEGSVWLLTGTPLLNRPPELWHVLENARLAQDAFGSWAHFCALFNGTRSTYGYDWGTPSEEAPLALQKVMLVRRRTQVLPDLPRKRHQVLEVNGLPAATVAALDAAVAALRARGIDIDNLRPEQDLGKLIAGPVFELMSRARAQLAAAKLPAAVELAEEYEEAGEPVIVFAHHVHALEALAARPGWALITGDVPLAARDKAVQDFQAGKLKGLAVSITAGGVGITLTRAAFAVFLELEWTPALNAQAEDRLCRIGQSRGVLIQRIVANHPLDWRVSELLAKKQEIIEASVEASAVEAEHQVEAPAAALARAAEQAAATVAAAPVAVAPKGTGPQDLPAAREIDALLLKASSSGLRTPRLLLSPELTVYRAGPASKYWGDLMLVEPGRKEGNKYYGRLSNGRLFPGRDYHDGIRATLEHWAEDPAEAARAYGHATHHCCFCGLDLTDERSTRAGYGPVCAEKWGLAWGD